MTDLFAWGHRVGAGLFLGSIASYVVASTLAAKASLGDLVFARRLIRTGTCAITVPAAWIAALAQMAEVLSDSSGVWRLAGWAVILLSSHLVVVPATGRCLDWARRSEQERRLNPAFRKAYWLESVPGAVNVALAILLLSPR